MNLIFFISPKTGLTTRGYNFGQEEVNLNTDDETECVTLETNEGGVYQKKIMAYNILECFIVGI